MHGESGGVLSSALGLRYINVVVHFSPYDRPHLPRVYGPSSGYSDSSRTDLHFDLPARSGPLWLPVDSGGRPKLCLSSSFRSISNNTHDVYAPLESCFVGQCKVAGAGNGWDLGPCDWCSASQRMPADVEFCRSAELE